MIGIYLKELNGFLNSLIGYLVIIVFLTAIGLLMWVFPETNVFDYGYAEMDTLFSLGPYVYMFLIPAITMRFFAEEKKFGTLELLLTRPVSGLSILLGKYLAGVSLVLISIVPTLLYYYALHQLGNPVGNLDAAGIAGSYVGLLLLGAVFTSIGVFASALTENQIVSFVIAVFLCFLIYSGFSSLAAMDLWSSGSLTIEKLGILYHYQAMSKGLIDSRDVIYFISVIIIMIAATNLVLLSRKW